MRSRLRGCEMDYEIPYHVLYIEVVPYTDVYINLSSG